MGLQKFLCQLKYALIEQKGDLGQGQYIKELVRLFLDHLGFNVWGLSNPVQDALEHPEIINHRSQGSWCHCSSGNNYDSFGRSAVAALPLLLPRASSGSQCPAPVWEASSLMCRKGICSRISDDGHQYGQGNVIKIRDRLRMAGLVLLMS